MKLVVLTENVKPLKMFLSETFSFTSEHFSQFLIDSFSFSVESV